MAKTPNTTATETVDQETGEVTSTAPAIATAPSGALVVGGMQFKVSKQITKPVLKQEEHNAVYVTFLSKITTGKEMKKKRDGGVDEKPAQVADVRDLSQGGNAIYTLIVSTVVESELKDNYPNDGYVNKSFAIEKLPKREGKRYNDYRIVEIEPIQAAE